MENVNGERFALNPTGRAQNDKEQEPKILFLITQSEIGGAQKFVKDASFWLAERGYNVYIATGANTKFPISNFQFPNNFQLKNLKRSTNPFSALLAIRETYQLIKKERPEVLFLCSTMAGFLGSIASKLYKLRTSNPKLRTLYRIGGWAFNDPRPKWQKKVIIWLERLTSRFKDKIIVNSEYDLQTALKYRIAPANKLVKIYNGINPHEIDFLNKGKAREKLFLAIKNKPVELRTSNPEPRTIIGTIANFYKTKGLSCLIKAIYLIKNKLQTSSFKLFIIGDGKERKNLEKLIAKYGLKDKVLLLGRIENASQYLKAFDIFVLPSLKEGFPWALLEAMAAEIPIIGAKVGAIPEILENEKFGLLVEPGNPEILAKKIQDLLENPEMGLSLARNAKTRLENFTQEKMMAEIEKQIKA